LKSYITLLAGLLLGCGDPEPEPDSFFDGWSAEPGDTGVEETPLRITFDLSVGRMTFDVESVEGSNLDLIGGVSWQDANGTQFWFTDGASGYALDTTTLLLSEPFQWVDTSGQPVHIEKMFVSTLNGVDLLIGVTGADYRVFDVVQAGWSDARTFFNTLPDTSLVEFAPTDVVDLKGFEGLGYYLMAIDNIGGLYFGSVGGVFQWISPVVEFGSLETLQPSQVLSLETKGGTLPERIAIVADNQVYLFDETALASGVVCFESWEEGLDENEVPFTPIEMFEADFDGDGVESIVWVHQ
jgi:hypothetical protein